jgi:L-lysine exporter family protein LysE/ArgO
VNGFWAGLSLGFSLILAIGAQNAFVLRQGLKKEYVFPVCFICSISDALLITFGVSGFSLMLAQMPWINPAARFGGALFLLIYGANSFWAAFKKNDSLLPSKNEKSSFSTVILTCLAFTWLNPHVYLDTVMLLGSI